MPRDDVTRATHGPLLSTRDRRALALCVVLGLLGWIVIFRLVDISLPPEQRTVEGPAENPAPFGGGSSKPAAPWLLAVQLTFEKVPCRLPSTWGHHDGVLAKN